MRQYRGKQCLKPVSLYRLAAVVIWTNYVCNCAGSHCWFLFQYQSNYKDSTQEGDNQCYKDVRWTQQQRPEFPTVTLTSRAAKYMYEWMNENLYIAHKKLPHKTLRVHSARYTQCMHVSSRKQKLPKDMHSYQKVQTAPTHPPLPKSGTIHNS